MLCRCGRFQLADPTLPLDPNTGDDGFPFSVKPRVKLTPQDLMRYQRDHYEGTPYDLTQGVAGQSESHAMPWPLRGA
jgi:dipeptidase